MTVMPKKGRGRPKKVKNITMDIEEEVQSGSAKMRHFQGAYLYQSKEL